MKKILPRLLIVVLFVVSARLILTPSNFSSACASGIFLLLNLTVILGAAYFGLPAAAAFAGFGILLALLNGLRAHGPIILPLFLFTATIGALYLYEARLKGILHRETAQLDNAEEERNVLSVELEHARLENASLKRKLHRYATLKTLTETLSAVLPLDEIVSLIPSEAYSIIGKSNLSILYLVDKEKQELNLAGARVADSSAELKMKKGDIFDQWVFKQRTPLLITDTSKDFRFNILKIKEEPLRPVRSLITVPLSREKKLLGILRLDNVSPKVYDTDDLRLLDIICDLSAVAIENTLLYQQSEKLAITDGLTGLFVHRYFHERLDEEIARSLWTDARFALLMFDIDDFKRYNDKYGHIAGDIVLKKIAMLIRSGSGPGNIVARYGGEEFGVLLLEVPKKEAMKTAEAVRRTIEKEKFTLRRETTVVKISGGGACFPEDGKVKEQLIKKADLALYKAKAEGKNRICI